MELTFDEDKHEYRVGGVVYKSVTQFLSQFFEPFDAEGIAEKLAKKPQNKKEGKDKEYFLNLWKERADHGTRVHEAIELYTNGGGGWIKLNHEDILKVHNAIRFLDNRDKKNLVAVTPEKKIFSNDIQLAGTIDRFELYNDRSISLIDWKTNNHISKLGFDGQMAKEPLEEYPDASITKYSLQLNLYAWMVLKELNKNKKIPYTVRELKLVHLITEGTGYEVYDIKYSPELIEEVLKYVEEKTN